MPSLVLDIALSAEQLLLAYQGHATRALITSREGKKVSLPLHHLRGYLTHAGVHGVFKLEFSDKGELLQLTRLR